MKSIKSILLSAALLSANYAAEARDLVFALSPYQAQDVTTAQSKAILQFLTQGEAGDKAIFLDGVRLQTIGVFTVPEGKAYTTPKARLAFNSKLVGALMQFSKKSKHDSNTAPSVAGALRLPQLLRYVAENYVTTGGVELVVIGSPLYDDPAEAPFSMAGGLIPSDGHLNASRAQTPFGAADTPNALQNVRVHWAYPDESQMPTDQHHYWIQRFWVLYLEKQGGTLASFAGDLPTVLQRVKTNAPPLKHTYKASTSETKLELIRLRRDTSKTSIYERPLSLQPLPHDVLRHAQHVEIGVRWDCDCDIDLYAQGAPKGALIYFGNSDTADGSHMKDFVQSMRGVNSFETIEFKIPIDLQRLRMGINLYRGNSAQGVHGEVRIAVDGQTYATNFQIKATFGNSGKGVKEAFDIGKATTDQTIFINPLVLIAK